MRGIAVPVLVVLWAGTARAESAGLRWSGDARAAATTSGAFAVGPAVRFRYGGRLEAHPSDAADRLFGSWFGFEVSLGLLAGIPAPRRYGAAVLVGARPWFSRSQNNWFLQSERWSVLGLLLPEAGACFGFEDARWYLGWDVPLGGDDFQIAPGLVWLSPGKQQPVLLTLAFRVPM